MIHQNRITWFKQKIEEKIYSEVKYVSEKNGDLGDLEGVQFNSPNKGGYIYFWSSGYIGFQIVDYKIGVEIVKDSLLEINEDLLLDEVLKDFLNELNKPNPTP